MIADFECSLREVNRRFSTENISVNRDWLAGCVEWFLSETPKISNEKLYKQACEQWLLSDFADVVGEKCLPVMVQNNEFTLNGYFPLQVQYLIDIAESAYEQLRNLYNQQLDEADEETEREQRRQNISKKKRMLKLELTDGHTFVIALERSPIPCLSTKLTPGSKILLQGPIRCVNKVLFLEPKNVKILGGEVEKLLIENAFENVLLKALGRPIKPNPQTKYQEIVMQQNQPKQSLHHVPPVPVVFCNSTTSINIINDDDDELFSNIDTDLLNRTIVPNSMPKPNHSTHTHILLDNDDDIFFNASIEHHSSVFNQNTKQDNRRPSNCDPIIIDDNSFDGIDMTKVEIAIQTEIRYEEERSHTIYQPPVRCFKKNIDFFDSDIDEMFPSDYDIVDSSQTYSNQIIDSKYEFKISGCPLVTIVQLNAVGDNDKNGKSFVIKCEIDSCFEKMDVENNQWTLGVFLKDSSDMMLQVRINNDVIVLLADVTAEEIQKMRSKVKECPQLKQELRSILENLKTKLTILNCFMKVEYSSKNTLPVVVELMDSRPDLEQILKNKLAKERRQ